MISLIVLVFLIHLFIYLVNTIGAKTFNDLLWQIAQRLPIGSSKQAQEQIRLRREVVRLKREMNGISAQDDFSRWAKARREHDKVLAAHDKVASEVQAARSSFDTKATGLRWISTTGLKFGIQTYHAKTPIFQLPPQWFPWYVEWLLGFPRCPYGGVSINVWGTACATVIALVGDAVGAVIVRGMTGGKPGQTEKGRPIQTPSQAQSKPQPASSAKKEL